MENKETKNGLKEFKNRIILKNLSKKQKEALTKIEIIGGVIGLGAGLLTLYSMKTPETTPERSIDTAPANEVTDFKEMETENSVELLSLNPVTEINDVNISFGEAFKVAREICGKGGWFIWKGDVYNTYYKEEWQALSPDEKNDYLASIEIHNFQKDENPNSLETLAIEQNENLNASSDGIKETNKPSNNNQDAEFTVDVNKFNNLEDNDVIGNIEQSDDIIQGEIITLDDDSEIAENGYFELPDDIDIITISEEESSLIETITFDSSEITSFPWEESSEETSTESLITDQEVISANLIEDTKNDEPENVLSEIEEYPWGEPIINPTETPDITQVIEETQKDENIKIVTNPDEIKEYPWGEPIETLENKISQPSIETEIVEIKEEPEQNHAGLFSIIEDFLWGEKNETSDLAGKNQVLDEVKENIGVILPEEPETEVLSQLPPSFNDVTEFPWGETVPHSPINPYNTPENDMVENHTEPTVE